MRSLQHPDLPAIGAPLNRLLFELAREEADEEAGPDPEQGKLWAALLYDGRDVADRARELITARQIDIRRDDIDPEDWARLEAAAGVIVTRDDRGEILVTPYEAEMDLASAWTAMMADLEPAEPGSPAVAPPESDDNPT